MRFQEAIRDWMMVCFGKQIAHDKVERNYRFLEEALELVQSAGASKEDAQRVVEYVYSRPAGELHQEIGGVMVTLAALCDAHGEDMDVCGLIELGRIWKCMDKIRAKQAQKPIRSALIGAIA